MTFTISDEFTPKKNHKTNFASARAIGIIFGIAAFLILSVGYKFYAHQKQAMRFRVESELELIARAKVDQISQWRLERTSDAADIMDSPFFGEAVQKYLFDNESGEAKLLARFHSLQYHRKYQNILLIDNQKAVRLVLDKKFASLHPISLEAFDLACLQKQPVLTDLFQSPEEDMIFIDVIAPLYETGKSNSANLGAIILRCDAKQFLYPLIESWPTASFTAETLLIRREGDHVIFLNELLHMKDTALKLTIPLTQTVTPSVMAVLGHTGIFEGIDYRNVRVISALKSIPNSPWFMVSKIDMEEAFSSWRRDSILIILLISGSLLLILAVAGVLWKNNEKRHYQSLYEAEAQVSRYTKELARSNAELQQFAYVASHDLQEPLRMISSYLQLIEKRYKGRLDSDADEFIAFAVDGASRLQALIQGLLTYSRVNIQGKPFRETDINTVFDRVRVNLMATIKEKGATVTRTSLPTLLADELQLTQLLQNLIANALKFSGPEPPHVHVSAEPKDGYWQFSVRDNGIGIDPQYHERIFALFQRLHSREEYPGTGIGLAVAKKTVERHGGSIWVESQAGKGSSFHFTIPMEPKETKTI